MAVMGSHVGGSKYIWRGKDRVYGFIFCVSFFSRVLSRQLLSFLFYTSVFAFRFLESVRSFSARESTHSLLVSSLFARSRFDESEGEKDKEKEGVWAKGHRRLLACLLDFLAWKTKSIWPESAAKGRFALSPRYFSVCQSWHYGRVCC